jgi:thiamine biosynthesis lipoprotein
MGFTRRQLGCLAGVMPLLGLMPAQARQNATLGGLAFGSYWRLSGAGSADAHRLRAHMETVIAVVDRAMSPYRPESDIMRFNASDSTRWFAVSPGTAAVVAAALSTARRCGGAFDPTVGPLVGQYGFGPMGGQRMGDYRQLSVRDGAIRKRDAGVSVDLCGIAKGYALDRAVQALDGAGLDHYLLEMGGEVFARGRHGAARPWQVAIEDPRPDATDLVHLVALDGQAIATSGNKRNGYDVAGQRFGHIVDPIASTCAATALLSVSVMAPQAIVADALATGIMAMGPERGAAFAAGEGIDALLLMADGPRLKTLTTGQFASRIVT